MGLIKFFASVGSGFILSPQTTRERSRKYQREANALLEEQLNAIENLAQQQSPTDARPRGTCPECLEMMLVGASTCPHCHTAGITWSTETTQEPVNTQVKQPPKTTTKKTEIIYQAKDVKNACYKCGGVAVRSGDGVRCMGKGCKRLRKGKYPHYFAK
jgi:DnaJ-class molecular chaperone